MTNPTDTAVGAGVVENGAVREPDGASAETPRDVARSAKTSLREAREDLKTEVRERTDQVKRGADRIATERKHTLAGTLESLASAFDAAAATLGEREERRLADWSRDLSGRARRAASYLEENDTRGLVNDLEGTAREHPAAFVGSSFAAGVAAGRFLRSSQRSDAGFGPTETAVEREGGVA